MKKAQAVIGANFGDEGKGLVTDFFAGGHGAMWDFPTDPGVQRVTRELYEAGGVVGAVCHGPAVFRHTRSSLGEPLVKDKRVTAFSDEEEEAVGLTAVVPFLVEDELKRKGGLFSKAGDWQPYVVGDGLLITGQNPASSGPAAERLKATLDDR